MENQIVRHGFKYKPFSPCCLIGRKFHYLQVGAPTYHEQFELLKGFAPRRLSQCLNSNVLLRVQYGVCQLLVVACIERQIGVIVFSGIFFYYKMIIFYVQRANQKNLIYTFLNQSMWQDLLPLQIFQHLRSPFPSEFYPQELQSISNIQFQQC